MKPLQFRYTVYPIVVTLLLGMAGSLLADDLLADDKIVTSEQTVPTDAFDVRPLLAGERAPTFSATAADGSTYQFDPAKHQKAAVILFYRGGWCPYCNAQLKQVRKIEKELLATGAELIFLSADKPELLAEAVADGSQLNYHLLSDNSMAIARSFGIAFQLDAATVKKYQGYGIDVEAASGFDHHQLPAPAVFVVDADGVIKFQYVNPDYSVRLSNEVLLAAAQTMPEFKLER